MPLKKFQLLFIATFALTIGSCSLALNSGKSSLMITQNDSVSVSVTSAASGFHVPAKQKGSSENEYKLSNQKDFYLAVQRKSGYLSNSTPLFRTKPNELHFIDYVVPLGIATVLLGTMDEFDDKKRNLNIGLAAGIGAYGLYLAIMTPKSLYEDEYALPRLYKIPTAIEYANFGLTSASLHLNSINYRVLNFSKIQDYLAHKSTLRPMDLELIHVANTDLLSRVERLFRADENSSSESLINISVVPNLTIGKVDFSFVGTSNQVLLKVDLTTYWSWVDSDSGAPMRDTIQTESSWGALYQFEMDTESGGFLAQEKYIEAVAKAILEMGYSPNFKPMNDKSKFREHLSDKWDFLEIRAGELSEVPTSKTMAAESVVTLFDDKGHGSGCVISSDGHIITNFHVIEDSQGEGLYATFANGKTLPVTIIRTNPFADLALVKVDSTGTRPVQLCYESEIGQGVFAIGTPADRAFEQSFSKGIISAIRTSGDSNFIQTDVSISPGNSGGALINEEGKLIGILRMKIIGNGVEGLGFAIPVKEIASSLKIEFK